jgi:aspartyl-tRNA(Asn)/glutamyl-tRNA(Gln) amidotransferase subunit B
MNFEAVIGLEIHVQLSCATKLFCDCPNSPGDAPNINTCPICLWLPGAIPRLSEEAVEKAAMVCLALNCRIQNESAFDQKVYYYPDLPKGYQLSQHHRPLGKNGWLEVAGEDGNSRRLRIHHVHMEEDVAKLVHEIEGRTPISLVDFNRAGTPLVEIVTEPDMRSAQDAMGFLRALRAQIRYTGSSDCSMEQGSMRVDANISIREKGSDQLNTKVEVKNMNSIRNVCDAIDYEIHRQIACIQSGEPVVLHTRLWDPDKHVTTAMRGKFAGPCVPDPSVPHIRITETRLQRLKEKLPEMPDQKARRFVQDYALPQETAALMSAERDLSEYFEAVVRLGPSSKTAAYWISAHLLPAMKDHGQNPADARVTPERLAGLLVMLENDEINAGSAKSVLSQMFENDRAPERIVEQSGFRQVSDADALQDIVLSVIEKNPSAVENYRNGKTQAVGFLMGQVMRATQGKANPKRVQEILQKALAAS